jgi:molybdopterin-guanine dinucleotide biosynthesis protein MobB
VTANPAVAFVADRSGSGKTTLLTEVLRLLKERGFRVGTVKHALHEVQLDREGTDSWHHTQAGADVCVIAGTGTLTTIMRRERPSLDEALALASRGTDIILVEGFKDVPIKKIEVYRNGHSQRLLCREPQAAGSDIIAVASDVSLDVPVPVLSLNDPVQVFDFIVEHFLNNKFVT